MTERQNQQPHHDTCTFRDVDGTNVLDTDLLEDLIGTVSMPYWYDDSQVLQQAGSLYNEGFCLNLDIMDCTLDLDPFTADSMAQQCGSQWGQISTGYDDKLCDMVEAEFTLTLRGLSLTAKAVVVSVARLRQSSEQRGDGLLLGIVCFLIDNAETRGREAATRYEHEDDDDVLAEIDDDILASAFYAIFPGCRR